MNQHRKSRQILTLFLAMAMIGISAAYATHTQNKISIIPILLYHDIQVSGEGDSIIARNVFLSHLDAIQEAGYETITFQQVIDFVNHGGSIPEKPILITFDDGYLSNYEIAWPALQQRGMVGTIFVVGCSVGKDTYKNTGVPIIPHFTYRQAREMIDSGVMSIQSHTYDLHQYRPLEPDGGREGVLPKQGEPTEVYRQALKADLQLSRDILQKNTESAIQVLAYPYGLYTTDSEFISTQLGFSITLTTQAEPAVLRRSDPGCLRLMGRYSVDDCAPEELLELIQI